MIILIGLNVYRCGSFNVYNVNVKLHFDIWLCFIDLEFLTHFGVKHPTKQCENAHPFIFLKILYANIIFEEP